MRLLFYSPQFLPSVGGLQNMVHYWALELSKKDHDIVVICTTPTDREETMPYRVYRSPSFGQTVSLMREAELVIMFNVSLKAIPQWWLSRTPLVISHHSAFRYPGRPALWPQRLKRFVANYLARKNIACSNYIALDYQNSVVVPNTFQADIFVDHRAGKEPYSLLFVGRLVTDKGIDLLAEAAVIMRQKKSIPLVLHIVGEGPELGRVNALADQYEWVRYHGNLPSEEVANLMNRKRILVVPSRLEPFGIVVLEGLACGCEVVASKEGGLTEAGDGLVHFFESGLVESLANCIERVFEGLNLNQADQRAAHLQRYMPAHSAHKLEMALSGLLTKENDGN